jgi:hypothetical protein
VSIEEKFFAMNGGEISLRMQGKWYIREIIRQVTSPYTVKHERMKDADGNDLFDNPWTWLTIITFDYPCLPREQITVRLSHSQNGIERAASTIKNQ